MTTFSKRSILNLNFPSEQVYNLTNCDKFANNFPSAANFAGPYVIRWTGASGEVLLNWVGISFTIDAALSTSFTKSFPDRFTATTVNPRIVFSFDSGHPLKNSADLRFAAGTNRAIVRLADEADFLAGQYFRTDYLQQLVDYYPSAVRTMNWFGGVDSHLMRWENRSLLTDPWWNGTVRFLNGVLTPNPSGNLPVSGTTSGTNIYTIAAIGSTPATEFHGHVVQCTIGTGTVRAGANTVTNVTKANPGVVMYSGADNYQNGDKVIFSVNAGMTELDLRIGTVANVNTAANTFDSGIDTSTFSTWSNGASTRTVQQYISLQLGTWAAYPVVFSDVSPGAAFGNLYIATGNIKSFYFDKGLVAAKDETTGVVIQGAWIFNSIGSINYHRAGVPPAVIIKFTTELNERSVASGKGPIDIWVNIPQRGMLSMDDDYDPDSNVAVNLVDLFLNGGDGVAAAPSNVRIFVELSNETWNGAAGFSAYWDFVRRGQLRWGFTGLDPDPWHCLRHAVMVSDIRAAFPNDLDRIVFLTAGQGTFGAGGTNLTRMDGADGTVNVLVDPLYVSIGGGPYTDWWDAFAFASYLETPTAFDTANLATLTTAWVNGNAAQKDQAITDYLVGILGTGNSQTVTRYRDTLLPEFNTAVAALGKTVIGYEGANQFLIRTTVNDQYNFLWAARSSAQWATLYRTWFDKWKTLGNAAMPGEYITNQANSGIDHTWDHISYGNADTYANGVEGAALDLAWDTISDYNNPRTTSAAPDPFSAEDLANLRHHQDELKKATQRRSKNKREHEVRLRDAVEEIYDKLSGIAPAAAAKVAAVIPAKAKITETAAEAETPAIDWSRVTAAQIAKVIATMDAYAAQLETEQRQQAIARADAAREQDEDDVESLLMSAP